MNVTNEMQELAGLLLQGTTSDKFPWRATSEPGVYRLVTEGGYIHLKKEPVDPPRYAIEVYDGDGGTLIEPEWVTRQDFGPVAELYEDVSTRFRRRAISGIVRDLRGMLEGKPRPPKPTFRLPISPDDEEGRP